MNLIEDLQWIKKSKTLDSVGGLVSVIDKNRIGRELAALAYSQFIILMIFKDMI